MENSEQNSYFCQAENGRIVHIEAPDVDKLTQRVNEKIWKNIFNGRQIKIFKDASCQNQIDTIDPN